MLFPAGAAIYRLVVAGRRMFGLVLATFHIRFSKIFTAKHVAHVAIATLAFLVTASNLYASNSLPAVEDVNNQSIISQIFQNQEEELLLEEFEVEPSNTEGISYLAGEAIRPEDYIPSADIAVSGSAPTSSNDVTGEIAYDPRSELMLDALSGDDATGIAAAIVGVVKKPTAASITIYEVQSGDTPSSIARRHGISVSTLLSANNMSTASVIRIGQQLKILPVDGILYTVRKGDVLSKIALKYQTTVSAMLDANNLVDPSQVAIGTTLILPGGRLPANTITAPAAKAPSRLANNIIDVFIPPSASSGAAGSSSRLLWPTAVKRITQYFKGRTHTGLDIAGPVGTAIYASDDGVVIFSGWNKGGYGNMIVVDHGKGLFTRYAHASKLIAKAGATVTRGEVIALMGSTGRSTGPHLHYEVMVGTVSARVNPFDYTALK